MIEGVVIEKLTKIEDSRGCVMHMLRADSPLYKHFGEVYFSIVKSGIVKAWKKHLSMTQNLTVPVGRVKFVIFDDRPGSPTLGEVQEIVVGYNEHSLLQIPPQVWYGFMGDDAIDSLVVNCATMPHDPGEVVRCDSNSMEIPYQWDLKERAWQK